MPQAFLSHSSKDKQIVHKVMDALNRSLVKTWIDEESIAGGKRLIEMISSGIAKSRYFFAFLSTDYLASNWCMDELHRAYSYFQRDEVLLIPVLLDSRDKLRLAALPPERRAFIEPLFQQIKYVEFDRYNEEKSIASLLDAFWMNELVRFEPIRVVTMGSIRVQKIELKLQIKDLPSNFLETCGLEIEGFMAESKLDPAPIQSDLPVAISGGGPIWLYAYLIIPFKNRRTVYVYNKPSNGYICVYSLPSDDALGQMLKESN